MLEEFAKTHRLEHSKLAQLPRGGGLPGRDSLEALATVTGRLPGGSSGTLAHLCSEYQSGDTTRVRPLTVVVLRVPESIGFAPYLADPSGAMRGAAPGIDTRTLSFDAGTRVEAAEGIDQGWLNELFSPALCDWLSRSPEDFGWELSDGVLCVSREQHLIADQSLVRLCEDAAHLAAALRDESLEEVETGGAGSSRASAKPGPQATLTASLVPLVGFDQPPANVAAAQPAFRELVIHHPSTYFIGLFVGIVWALVINVITAVIVWPVLTLDPSPLAIALFEAVVISTTTLLAIRSEIDGRSRSCAVEAFWREYARARELELVDALEFAATHAKAELPGKPHRVLSGRFDSVTGSLLITGDGLRRGDSIALVAGSQGPVASADFEASAPGPSAKLLDDYARRLAAELATARREA